MKKYISIFLSLVFLLTFSSCDSAFELKDTVTIEGKEYKRAFVGELYPALNSAMNDGVKISGKQYYKYSEALYDCYVAYDVNAEPNVYFETKKYDEANSYYRNSNNFEYYCLVGNIHDADHQRFEIEDIDSLMFDKLIDFSFKNDYNPLTSFNNEEGLKKYPINTSDWTSDEIHFYKETKDDSFFTSKGYTFKVIEDKLTLLYNYNFGDENAPFMLVREIPSDISDYFCSLLNDLKKK